MQILFEGGDGATKPEVFYNANDKALIEITPVITNMSEQILSTDYNGFTLKSENVNIDKVELNLNGVISTIDFTTNPLNLVLNTNNTLLITYVSSNGIRSKTTTYVFEYIEIHDWYKFRITSNSGYQAKSPSVTIRPPIVESNQGALGLKAININASPKYVIYTINGSSTLSDVSNNGISYNNALNSLGNNDVMFKFNLYSSVDQSLWTTGRGKIRCSNQSNRNSNDNLELQLVSLPAGIEITKVGFYVESFFGDSSTTHSVNVWISDNAEFTNQTLVSSVSKSRNTGFVGYMHK